MSNPARLDRDAIKLSGRVQSTLRSEPKGVYDDQKKAREKGNGAKTKRP
jgi:hypothetical protein